MDISFVCSECGKNPEVNEEKSNDNWQVFDSDCKHCGGRLKPILKN